MTDPGFDIGDVVRLKSGGPPMTIIGWLPRSTTAGRVWDRAFCQWVVTRKHQITGDLEHIIGMHGFEVATLTKSPQDQVK